MKKKRKLMFMVTCGEHVIMTWNSEPKYTVGTKEFASYEEAKAYAESAGRR